MSTSIFEIALAELWAIDRAADENGREFAKLRQILEIAAREHSADELETLQFRRSAPLSRTEDARERDGVAILEILGPTFPRANLMTRISGATSLETVGRDLVAAIEDPRITGVILDIDSPGGAMKGTNALAKQIGQLRDQVDKPIVAFAAGDAASAAYWVGSAVGRDRLFADETAQLGSIGVVLATLDTRKRDAARGVQEITFVSSQSPLKRVDPTTEAGAAVLQRKVDDAATVFIEAVAGNRGVSAELVAQDFGQGDTMLGRAAVGADMADGVSSFEELLAALAGGEFGGPANRGRSVFIPQQRELDTMAVKTAADLVATYPALAGEIKAEGRAEGLEEGKKAGLEEGKKAGLEEGQKIEAAEADAKIEAALTAERARIAALTKATPKGYEDKLEAAIAAGTSPGDLALEILEAQKTAGKGHFEQLGKDRQALGKLPANTASDDAGAKRADQGDGQGGGRAKTRAEVEVEASALAEKARAKVDAAKAAGRTLTVSQAMAQVKADQAAA
jgi:ClpP class serine protease